MNTQLHSTAVLMTAIGQVQVASAELPTIESDEVLVATQYTCISPGTELRCLAGKEANTTWPFIPGYAVTGIVIDRGASADVPIGSRVICPGSRRASHAVKWGGHMSHVIVKAAQTLAVPETVDPLDAAIVKLAAIAYRGVRLSQPKPHENVAVIGLGVIGQLAARLHALTGAHVVAADVDPFRVEVAQRAGSLAVVSDKHRGAASALREYFPEGADVVVDATGVPAALHESVGAARDVLWQDGVSGPRLVIQGSYAEDFSLNYQQVFKKEIVAYVPRDQQRSDLQAVLGLMARGVLAGRDLISAVYAPRDAAQAYADLRSADTPRITAAFQWTG
jgi:2-desacetyl-2-hydroxyethyl bacteriochlorophyllide A dehydrogenase